MKKTTPILLSILLLLSMELFADGQSIYKKCSGCHGEYGETKAFGKSALIGTQESNLTIKELTAYRNGELNQYGLGNIMKMQLITLSDKEISEVAEYIQTLDVNETK